MLEKVLKSGTGWRIGWNPTNPYPGLVGADDWAFELTSAELEDFCRLLEQLVDNMRSISAELMEDENIACEAETSLLWMQASGLATKYSLRLILSSERGCEGNWGVDAIPDLVTAVSNLKLF
jgi:Domain of unknown function (DUF1818)